MRHQALSEVVTRDIRVRVESRYLPDQVPDEQADHLFGYRIVITNETTEPVQLIRRYWLIIDANGDREEIDGPGVIGQQPTIAPGESYSYGSFCPLDTDWGTMEGHYEMRQPDGSEFAVAIGRFHLFVPRELSCHH